MTENALAEYGQQRSCAYTQQYHFIWHNFEESRTGSNTHFLSLLMCTCKWFKCDRCCEQQTKEVFPADEGPVSSKLPLKPGSSPLYTVWPRAWFQSWPTVTNLSLCSNRLKMLHVCSEKCGGWGVGIT